MVTPGSDRRLQDRYVLRSPLGRGGMGVVWLADDEVLQRQVAIKEIEFPAGVPDDEIDSLRARVMREARAAGRLNHPNVTTIFDVISDDGREWIVMEYVDAPTLTEVVTAEGPLSVAKTVEVGGAVLSAIRAAHAQGIVHRDVKPGNVMVPAVGNTKLADFGVATVQGDPKLTMTGLIIGSPSYMAPEQAQEGQSTEASDLWGLGATLYYCVEGAPPFDKGAAIPTLTAVSYEPPRQMERAGPLGPVIERLLSKAPDERPTAGELQVLLDEVASELGGSGAQTTAIASSTAVFGEEPTQGLPAATPVTTTAPDPTPARTAFPEPVGAAAEHRRSPWPLLLVVFALTALAAFAVTRMQPDTARSPGNSNGGNQAQRSDAPATEGEATTAPDTVAVPDDWAEFEVADTGTSVRYPPSWSPVTQSETATDLTDPEGGRYLRVDYTTSPGDDAAAAWEDLSDAFGADHEDYTEISIDDYDYPGAETAALWEYTYTDGGAELHAYNLAIVTGGVGYALNFQSHEDQWDDSQELWEQFVASFDPAE